MDSAGETQMSMGQEFWNVVIGCGIAIIGYFLRDMRETLNKQIAKQDERIDKIVQNLVDLREELPMKYVLRDDFLRAVSGLDNRIDSGFKEISKQIQNRLKGG